MAGGAGGEPGTGKMSGVTLIVFLLAMLTVLGCGGAQTASPDAPDVSLVRIGGEAIYAVDLAVTSGERQQGLSGRETMAEDAGMLFVFEEEQPLAFWMKDMRFPLDIIWIDGQCRLISVAADVPTPPPNAGNDEIPRVQSPCARPLRAGAERRRVVAGRDVAGGLGGVPGRHRWAVRLLTCPCPLSLRERDRVRTPPRVCKNHEKEKVHCQWIFWCRVRWPMTG